MERQNRPLSAWKWSISLLIRFITSICKRDLQTVSHVFVFAGEISFVYSESITRHCHYRTVAPLGWLKMFTKHKAMGVPTEVSVFLLEMYNQLQGWSTNCVGAFYSLVPNSGILYSVFSWMLSSRTDAKFYKWEVVLLVSTWVAAVNNATLGKQFSCFIFEDYSIKLKSLLLLSWDRKENFSAWTAVTFCSLGGILIMWAPGCGTTE